MSLTNDLTKKGLKRKLITLDCKLDVIERFDNGESKAYIGRVLGLADSTVRAILNNATKYREQGKVAAASLCMETPLYLTTRNRNPIMIEMEDLLFLWVEDCNQKCIPIHTNNIMQKALSLFSRLKESKYQGVTTSFSASKGWYENFKSRTGMKKLKITKDLMNNDEDFVTRYEVQALMASFSKDLSDDDLLAMKDQQEYNNEEKITGKKTIVKKVTEEKENTSKKITTKELEYFFHTIQKAKDLLLKIDPNVERSSKVCRGLEKQIGCYRKIFSKNKKTKNIKLINK